MFVFFRDFLDFCGFRLADPRAGGQDLGCDATKAVGFDVRFKNSLTQRVVARTLPRSCSVLSCTVVAPQKGGRGGVSWGFGEMALRSEAGFQQNSREHTHERGSEMLTRRGVTKAQGGAGGGFPLCYSPRAKRAQQGLSLSR